MAEQSYIEQPPEVPAGEGQQSTPEMAERIMAEQAKQRYNRAQTAALLVLATGAVLTLMWVAKPVLVVTLVSVLLAFVMEPLVSIMERIRVPRAFGSLVAMLVFCGICYGITYFSYYRAVSFLEELPHYSGKIRSAVIHFRKQAETIQKTTQGVLPDDQEDKNAVKVKQTKSWSDTLVTGAMNTAEIVLLIGFIPFLAYFMLSWKEHVRAATVMLFKMENRNTAYVTLGLISEMIRSFIVGNVIVGIFVSIVSMIVFAWMRLPYFYFLGFISGFLSLVPYLGVILAMVPPVVAGMGVIKSQDFLVIVITVIGLHLFAINVLYPKLIGRRLQLNPLAVTLALLFWGWLWGAMGLILAVPIAAAMKIIFDHVESLRPYANWLGE